MGKWKVRYKQLQESVDKKAITCSSCHEVKLEDHFVAMSCDPLAQRCLLCNVRNLEQQILALIGEVKVIKDQRDSLIATLENSKGIDYA